MVFLLILSLSFMTVLVNIQTQYLESNISIYKLGSKGKRFIFVGRAQMSWNYQEKEPNKEQIAQPHSLSYF